MRHLRKRLAAIPRDVNAAADAAAVQHVRLQLDLPRAGDDDVRIFLRELETGTAGILIDEQHVLPCLAAVFGPEDTAFLLRPRGAAQRARHHDVLVGRMDDDGADAAGMLEPHRVHVSPASMDL